MDLIVGELGKVAGSEEEFRRLCEDEKQREKWFSASLLNELRNVRGELRNGECFSCKIPLSLGGQMTVDNFDRCNLHVHYSMLGQLQQQTKHLPPGTKIDAITIGSAEELAPRKSWWRRLVGDQ